MILSKLFPFCKFTSYNNYCNVIIINNIKVIIEISEFIKVFYKDYESFIQSVYSFFKKFTPKDFKHFNYFL